MTGPASAAEILGVQAELIRILDRHVFYCDTCLVHSPCDIADMWRNTVAATVTLLAAAKVVDGDDTQD